jgi:hypothetical protein
MLMLDQHIEVRIPGGKPKPHFPELLRPFKYQLNTTTYSDFACTWVRNRAPAAVQKVGYEVGYNSP